MPRWPPAKMFTTADDCYTGQRLVVGQDVAQRNGIPLAHATAASSSLPGVNLLDPNEIAPALRAGYDRAKAEAPKIRAFYA